MATTSSELKTKLERVTSERDKFVESANQQVTFLNGKIAMLEELIDPPQTARGETENASS